MFNRCKHQALKIHKKQRRMQNGEKRSDRKAPDRIKDVLASLKITDKRKQSQCKQKVS
jgi:hypothetical protein